MKTEPSTHASLSPPAFDSERLTFLRALDIAAVDGIEVTDWEAKFIGSALKYQTGAILFSDPQRQVIDRMWCRYGPRIKGGSSGASPHLKLNLPETVPGKCAWLLKREGDARQTRCGHNVGAGNIFCPDHEQERARVKAKLAEANRRWRGN